MSVISSNVQISINSLNLKFEVVYSPAYFFSPISKIFL